MTHVARVLCFCLVAACSINHRSGDFLCETQADCTSDRTCSNGVCVQNGNPIEDAPSTSEPDAPEEFRCPTQCTSCVEATKTCNVDCGAPAAAAICAQAITCPDGFNCVIKCSRNAVNGNNQCQQKIDCQNAASCDVQCTGTNTCKAVLCGDGPCDVTCTGAGTCQKVDCDQSCKCDVECSFTANCSDVSCPGSLGQCTTIGMIGCNSLRSDACHSCP
jgi:hypothetical protein